jgi:cytochrome P450
MTAARSRRPAILEALALARDPEGFLEACRSQRGDPFVVRLPGVGEVFVTGDPEGAREIFSAAPETFEPLRDNPVEPLLGKHSLILLQGDRHRRERKLMSPPFHGDRMRAYATLFRDLTLAEIARWVPGEPVMLQAVARRITLEVIIRAVFGVQDAARMERFRETIVRLLDAYTAPLVVLPALRRGFGGAGPWARFTRARDAFVAMLHAEIAERRGEGAGAREDVLSLLLEARYDDGTALSPAELVDELSTLLVAGHETTATALVWALAYVHRDARVLASVTDEARALGAAIDPTRAAELPYVGAVCSEALRVHPVVPIAIRRVVQPFRLRGADVPAGGTVAVATTLLHTHPELWPEPSRFRPERFLERKFSPFEYAPFGGGARRCLGAAFATYEMKIVLATIFARARLAAETHAPLARPVLHNITMGPSSALALKYVGPHG